MNLLHTIEEIKQLDRDVDLATELIGLVKRYKRQDLRKIADELLDNYADELVKYDQYIGTVCHVTPSYPIGSMKRQGKIEKFTHFNYFSKSVRCDVRYNGGGYDNYALTELEEIK